MVTAPPVFSISAETPVDRREEKDYGTAPKAQAHASPAAGLPLSPDCAEEEDYAAARTQTWFLSRGDETALAVDWWTCCRCAMQLGFGTWKARAGLQICGVGYLDRKSVLPTAATRVEDQCTLCLGHVSKQLKAQLEAERQRINSFVPNEMARDFTSLRKHIVDTPMLFSPVQVCMIEVFFWVDGWWSNICKACIYVFHLAHCIAPCDSVLHDIDVSSAEPREVMASDGLGDRGKLLRQALLDNPTNDEHSENPFSINRKTLQALEEGSYLSQEQPFPTSYDELGVIIEYGLFVLILELRTLPRVRPMPSSKPLIAISAAI
ncbi:hypothetical protein LA080_007028 [Diaporthe eres]|nr:hypothetical protein LA080_007028 [Diaporthe eres]